METRNHQTTNILKKSKAELQLELAIKEERYENCSALAKKVNLEKAKLLRKQKTQELFEKRMTGKFKLITNLYGNVEFCPKGWINTNISIIKLKNNGIPYYKLKIDWHKSGKFWKPVLVTIAPKVLLNKFIKHQK